MEQEAPISDSEQEVPLSEEKVPASEEKALNPEEGFPVSEEGVPVSEEAVPVSEEEVPVSEEEVPVSEEEVPVSADDGRVSEEEDAVSEEAASERDGPVSDEEPSLSGDGAGVSDGDDPDLAEDPAELEPSSAEQPPLIEADLATELLPPTDAELVPPISPSNGSGGGGGGGEEQLPWHNMQQWLHSIVVVAFDIELGQIVQQIYPPHVSLSPKEKSNVCFLSFPDSNSGCMGNTVYSFRIRQEPNSSSGGGCRGLSAAQKHHFNVYSNDKYNAFQNYFYGAVQFRQMKDTSIKRGYFQKSVVLLSNLPFVALFLEMVKLIAEDFFLNGDVSLEAAAHDVDQWPYPAPGGRYQLPLLGRVLEVSLPFQGINSPDGGGGGLQVAQVVPSPQTGSLTLSSAVDLDLYSCFHTLLSHLQLIWELVLLGQPIVVMASSPDLTSRMVHCLTSIIYPLKWGADYRPFFTIHDSEFKEYTASTGSAPPPNIIIGVTNPFFAKTLQHWPNVIRIGEAPPENGAAASPPAFSSSSPASNSSQASKNSGKKSSRVALKVLDAKPGVYTHHKLFLEKDKAFVKKLSRSRDQQHQPSHVLNASIRKFYRELTESFVIPLERYLSSLMPLAKTLSPWKDSPQLKPFVQSEFLKQIEKAGPQLTSRLKGNWIGLYKAFLESHNFHCWLTSRRSEINQRLQLVHLDAISQANLADWLENRSEVEAVDLLIKLKEKLRRLSSSHIELDEKANGRIQDMMRSIAESLPEDLKQSILSNSMFSS